MLGQRPDGVHGLRGHVVEIQGQLRDRPLPGVRPRERQQVPHDLAQPRRLALDRLERHRVPGRVAILPEGDLGPGAENRDGSPQLVGSVRHEAAHLLHRALDRRAGLPHQQRAAADDEQQGGEGGRPERLDQRRVLVLELHPIGDRDGDVSGARRPAERFGIEPQLGPAAGVQVAESPRRLDRLAGGGADRVRDLSRFDRLEVPVEQVQRPIGDVQLVHRIHHGSMRTRPFRFANPSGLLEGGRGGAQRGIQVPGHLIPYGHEQPAPQEGEHEHKDPCVPGGELEAQPRERLHHGHVTARTGIPRRAAL